MNTLNCTSSPCLSCDDSGLSTTSSIIGILTFAITLLVAFRVQFYAAQNASEELIGIMRDLHLKRAILDQYHTKGPRQFRPESEKTRLFHGILGDAIQCWGEAYSLGQKFAPDLYRFRQRRKRFLKLATYVGGPKELMTKLLNDLDKNMSIMKDIENDVFYPPPNPPNSFEKVVMEELNIMSRRLIALEEMHVAQMSTLLEQISRLSNLVSPLSADPKPEDKEALQVIAEGDVV